MGKESRDVPGEAVTKKKGKSIEADKTSLGHSGQTTGQKKRHFEWKGKT